MVKGLDDESEDSEQQTAESEAPQWCKCIVCRTLPKEQENKCCNKKTCVTSYQVFREAIINRNALELAMKLRFDMLIETFEFTTNEYRKAAYRQYTAWKYGRLGQGNRRVIPACVVRMIRTKYPNKPGEPYMGFKER